MLGLLRLETVHNPETPLTPSDDRLEVTRFEYKCIDIFVKKLFFVQNEKKHENRLFGSVPDLVDHVFFTQIYLDV